jgi:steroid delta-isomerase-like uncharacterized protein
MSEENKALARRFIEEAFNQGNLDVIDETTSSEWVHHDPAMPEEGHGPEGAKQFVQMYRSAFPDTHITIEDQVAEGDKVVTRWTARGTHEGELMGITPTGNRVEITGITIDRIEGGKTVETWDHYDALGMMQQLGVMEQPSE